MHNHLTVDLALSIFPEFGSDDFFNFISSIRSISIGKACKNNLPGLIITNCYTHADSDTQSINEWSKIVTMQGGSVLPIFLDVPLAILKQRVSDASRRNTQKIQTQEALEQAMEQQVFGPINSPNTLTIASGDLSVEETVAQIIQSQSAH